MSCFLQLVGLCSSGKESVPFLDQTFENVAKSKNISCVLTGGCAEGLFFCFISLGGSLRSFGKYMFLAFPKQGGLTLRVLFRIPKLLSQNAAFVRVFVKCLAF